MLVKRIIPCLDVKEGRVVKGVRFLKLKDAGDPVRAAKYYDEAGADELSGAEGSMSAKAGATNPIKMMTKNAENFLF